MGQSRPCLTGRSASPLSLYAQIISLGLERQNQIVGAASDLVTQHLLDSERRSREAPFLFLSLCQFAESSIAERTSMRKGSLPRVRGLSTKTSQLIQDY